MKGSSYGEGLINSSSIGVEGGLTIGRYSLKVEGGVYSTGENNAGLFLNVSYDVDATKGILKDLKLDVSGGAYIKANTTNQFSQEKALTNETTISGDATFQRGLIGVGASADVPVNGGKPNASFKMGVGKSGSDVNLGAKNSTKAQIKTDAVNLGGR